MKRIAKNKKILQHLVEKNDSSGLFEKEIKGQSYDLNQGDFDGGNSLLHLAAVNGAVKICEILLKEKVDINQKNSAGYTPLHLAASLGQKEICQLLLKDNPNISIKTNNGETALQLAKEALKKEEESFFGFFKDKKDFEAIVDILGEKELERKKELDNITNLSLITKYWEKKELEEKELNRHDLARKDRRLFGAVESGDAIYVESNKANISDKISSDGLTLLQTAIAFDDYRIYQILASVPNLNFNIPGSNGITPLHIAILRGNLKIFNDLLKRGANAKAAIHSEVSFKVDVSNKSNLIRISKLLTAGSTALDIAKKALADEDKVETDNSIFNEKKSNLKQMIISLEKLEFEELNKELFTAIESENLEEINNLLKPDLININGRDKDGLTPFYKAVLKGNYEICKLLLKNGADINCVCESHNQKDGIKKGETPKIFIERTIKDLVDSLNQKGGKLTVERKRLKFHISKSEELKQSLKASVKKKEKTLKKQKEKFDKIFNLLSYVDSSKESEAEKEEVEKESQARPKEDLKKSANDFLDAAKKHGTQYLKYVFDNRPFKEDKRSIFVDTKDYNGWTALHFAIMRAKPNMVRFLLEEKKVKGEIRKEAANPQIKTINGYIYE